VGKGIQIGTIRYHMEQRGTKEASLGRKKTRTKSLEVLHGEAYKAEATEEWFLVTNRAQGKKMNGGLKEKAKVRMG